MKGQSLASSLAGARVTTRARLGGFEPVRRDFPVPRCHAGGGHDVARDRGSVGVLCDSCSEAADRLLARLTEENVGAA